MNNKNNKIYVGNLPYRFSEQELSAIFEPFGELEQVAIVKDPQGVSKGFGFVTFKSEESAQNAVAELTNVSAGGRTLKISLAHDKERPERPRHSAGSGGNGGGFKSRRPRRNYDN
jgi:RNA recognition motif-containing protein